MQWVTCKGTHFERFGPGPGDARGELYGASTWHACRTRGRAEKKVDRLLAGAGIESYLPLIVREREWADRRKRVAFPLFPGYIFARFKLTELYDVLRTPGLVTVVQLDGHPTPVRDEEIDSVRALVEGVNATGHLPTPGDYLLPGDEVEVVEGPFRGMRGVLLQERGDVRVVVRLASIRLAVGVEMNRQFLQPAQSLGGRVSGKELSALDRCAES